MHKSPLTLLLLLLLSAPPAQAVEAYLPPEIVHHVPNAQAIATARFSYMLWDLYDATLYTASAEAQITPPFALRLRYLMNIPGRSIANRSIEEIRREGRINEITLAQWHSQLQAIIPDVKTGEVITGIVDSDLATHFYKNGQPIGVMHDPVFTPAFFKIWLGRDSTDTSLRQQLILNSNTGEVTCAQNFCN